MARMMGRNTKASRSCGICRCCEAGTYGRAAEKRATRKWLDEYEDYVDEVTTP